jgi:hypothetical protein
VDERCPLSPVPAWAAFVQRLDVGVRVSRLQRQKTQGTIYSKGCGLKWLLMTAYSLSLQDPSFEASWDGVIRSKVIPAFCITRSELVLSGVHAGLYPS